MEASHLAPRSVSTSQHLHTRVEDVEGKAAPVVEVPAHALKASHDVVGRMHVQKRVAGDEDQPEPATEIEAGHVAENDSFMALAHL